MRLEVARYSDCFVRHKGHDANEAAQWHVLYCVKFGAEGLAILAMHGIFSKAWSSPRENMNIQNECSTSPTASLAVALAHMRLRGAFNLVQPRYIAYTSASVGDTGESVFRQDASRDAREI